MRRYLPSGLVSRTGVNYVRSIVEAGGCLFHKIDQDNDLGVDALVEVLKEGVPANTQVALQIKSGQSYYDSRGNSCVIPVERHYEYWSRYPLPVIGIVYVPSLQTANWIDIKRYFELSGECSAIRFDRNRSNGFDAESFRDLFMPALLGELPFLSLEAARSFLKSEHFAEHQLALLVLFRRYPNDEGVWEDLIDYFLKTEVEAVPPMVIYFLSHIPGHRDIFYHGKQLSEETRQHAARLMSSFGQEEYLKLLQFVDEEQGISRGTLGQAVEAIISSLPQRNTVLAKIIRDGSVPLPIREWASLIYAYHLGEAAVPTIEPLIGEGSWFIQEMIQYISRYGGVSLYD